MVNHVPLALTRRFLELNDESCLAAVLGTLPPVDVASLLTELTPLEQVVIVRLLTMDHAAGVFSVLDDRTLEALVPALDEVEITNVLQRIGANRAREVRRFAVRAFEPSGGA